MTTTTTTRKLPAVPTGTEILLKARDSHRFAARECLSYASAAHTAAEAAEHADKAAWNFRAVAAAEALLVELDALRNAPPFATVPGQDDDTPSTHERQLMAGAYRALAAETGFPAVKLFELAVRSTLPIATVHTIAREMHEAGQCVLSVGDWSLASTDDRLAVLQIGSERYLQIRFL